MPLLLNDEQAMLRDTARDFLVEQAPVAQLRRLRDDANADGFSRELWSAFADMGFTGILVPETHGGLGLGMIEAGVVLEEIGANLTASPFFSTSVLGASALKHGSLQQQQVWLPRIAAGEVIVALAIEEGGKHRPERIALKAERAGNGFQLDGAKALVIDGHAADLLIVAARTAGEPGTPEGLTLFLVDPRAPGVEIERIAMVDSHNAARVRFTDVLVDADAVLGQVDQGWSPLERTLEIGRAGMAAEMVGLGAQAFQRTLAYLKERRQFGRLIGEFQALQHRAAQLYTDLEIARAAVLKALQVLDMAPGEAAAYVAVAKAKAGQASALAVQEAVQMHGGMGMTDAFDIGFFMKRQRVLEELFGDAGFQARRLARLHGY